MDKSFLGANIQMLIFNAEFKAGNSIHIILNISHKKYIKSSRIDFELIFSGDNKPIDILSFTFLLTYFIHLQAFYSQRRLQYGDQLRNFLLVTMEVPDPQLLLVGNDQFIVKII